MHYVIARLLQQRDISPPGRASAVAVITYRIANRGPGHVSHICTLHAGMTSAKLVAQFTSLRLQGKN